MHPDVNKGSEVDNVEHRAEQFHADGQVLEFENPLLEERLRQVLAGIASRTGKLFENVGQQQPPHAKFMREDCQIDAGCLLGQGFGRQTARQIGGAAAQFCQHLLRDRVALGVDPGGIERVDAARDLQEADRLDVRCIAEPGHLEKLLP